MTYVISDLHGYPLARLKELLDKAGFCDEDMLYILGDVVDRNGDGGVGILRWLLTMPNAELILGNHEGMLLACDFILDYVDDDFISSLSEQEVNTLAEYFVNGGDVTIKALQELNRKSQSEVYDIFEYIKDCPVYDIVEVNGTDFLLCHSGINNFDKSRALSSYKPDDFIWNRPELTDEYYNKAITVFGHTPTLSYGDEYRGKIIKTKSWIDIDVGASFGIEPVLLRLDDMAEFRNE